MPLTVNQAFPFVSGSDSSQVLSYIVYGAEGDYSASPSDMNGDQSSEAAIAALAISPATYDGLARRSVTNITHQSDRADRIQFKIEITYGEFQVLGQPTPQPFGTLELSYITELEPVHVVHSLEVVNRFGNITAANDNGTLIGVDVDGNVAGADEFVARSRFAFDWTLDSTTITETIRNQWKDLVGKVNADVYHGRQPGEVMFQGINDTINYTTGAERNSFMFEERANIEDDPGEHITLAGFAGMHKKGWEIFDPVYIRKRENGQTRVVIDGFKVHRLAEYVDFGGILPFAGVLQ